MTLQHDIPASFGKRFGAILIDCIVVGIFGAVLKTAHINFPMITSYIYFCTMTFLLGQTLGKKALGIQVVSLKSEKLSIGQVLMRETIGKFISALVFFIGYLKVAFDPERMAWHDTLAKTQVVLVDTSVIGNDYNMPAWQKGAIGLFVFLFLCFGFVFALLFTPYPLRQIAQKAELEGTQIDGIHGSIMRGFTIDSLSYSNDSASVSLKEIAFSFDFSEFIKTKNIHIKNVSVSSGSVHRSDLTTNENKSTSPKKEAQTDSTAKVKKEKTMPEIQIDQIDLADLEFTGQGKSFKAPRFYLENVHYKSNEFTLGRLFVESDALDADIMDLRANKELITIAKYAKIKLKNLLVGKYVKNDIDLDVLGEYSLKDKTLSGVHVGLCHNRVQISGDKTLLQFKTYGYSAQECLGLSSPINNLNLIGSIDVSTFKSEITAASFFVRGAKFDKQDGNRYTSSRGTKVFTLIAAPTDLLMPKGLGGTPLKISNQTEMTSSEWLASLYFDRQPNPLVPTESSQILADSESFVVQPVIRLPSSADRGTTADISAVQLASLKLKLQAQTPQLRERCNAGNQQACAILKAMGGP